MTSRIKPMGWLQGIDPITGRQITALDEAQADCVDLTTDTITGDVTLLSEPDLDISALHYGGGTVYYAIDVCQNYIDHVDWDFTTDAYGMPYQDAVAGGGNEITFTFTLPQNCEWQGIRIYIDPANSHTDPIGITGGDRFHIQECGYTDLSTGTETALIASAVHDALTAKAAYEAVHTVETTFASPSASWDSSKHIGWVTIVGEYGASAIAGLKILSIQALIQPDNLNGNQ